MTNQNELKRQQKLRELIKQFNVSKGFPIESSVWEMEFSLLATDELRKQFAMYCDEENLSLFMYDENVEIRKIVANRGKDDYYIVHKLSKDKSADVRRIVADKYIEDVNMLIEHLRLFEKDDDPIVFMTCQRLRKDFEIERNHLLWFMYRSGLLDDTYLEMTDDEQMNYLKSVAINRIGAEYLQDDLDKQIIDVMLASQHSNEIKDGRLIGEVDWYMAFFIRLNEFKSHINAAKFINACRKLGLSDDYPEIKLAISDYLDSAPIKKIK